MSLKIKKSVRRVVTGTGHRVVTTYIDVRVKGIKIVFMFQPFVTGVSSRGTRANDLTW